MTADVLCTQMIEMGFEREAAIEAYFACDRDLGRAVEFLVSQ